MAGGLQVLCLEQSVALMCLGYEIGIWGFSGLVEAVSTWCVNILAG